MCEAQFMRKALFILNELSLRDMNALPCHPELVEGSSRPENARGTILNGIIQAVPITLFHERTEKNRKIAR